MWLRFIFRSTFGGFKSTTTTTTTCAAGTGARACDGPAGDAEAEAGATAAPLSTAESIGWGSLGEKSNRYLIVEVVEFSNIMFNQIPLGPATQTCEDPKVTWDRFDILQRSGLISNK